MVNVELLPKRKRDAQDQPCLMAIVGNMADN